MNQQQLAAWLNGSPAPWVGEVNGNVVWMTLDGDGRARHYVATEDFHAWYVVNNAIDGGSWWGRLEKGKGWSKGHDDPRVAGPFYNHEAAMAALRVIST